MDTYDHIFIGAGSAACTLAQGLTGNAHKVWMLSGSDDLIKVKPHEAIPRTKVVSGVPRAANDLVRHTIGDEKRRRVHMSRINETNCAAQRI